MKRLKNFCFGLPCLALFIAASNQVYGNDDVVRAAIERDGYAAVTGSFRDPEEGNPFRTRLNFDATEQVARLQRDLSSKQQSPDRAYSDTFKKSFFGVPKGGFFYGEIEISDLQRITQNREIESVSLQTTFKLSDADAYSNAEMSALGDAPSDALTGVGVRVAVLDGNIRTDHPGLANLAIQERCYSPNAAGKKSQYPSCRHNGAQVTQSDGPGTAGGSEWARWPHGTAVAGLIKSSNAPPCAPGAPSCPQVRAPSRDVDLVAIRVSGNPTSTHDQINSQQASMALDWIIQENQGPNPIKVVNLSWGSTILQHSNIAAQFPYNYSTCDSYVHNGDTPNDLAELSVKVQVLYSQGTIVVAASGNNRLTPGTAGMDWPACLSTVTSVSGVGDGGQDVNLRQYPSGVHVPEYQASTMTRVAATGALMTSPWVTYNNLGSSPNYIGFPFTVRDFTYSIYNAEVNQSTPYTANAISGTSFAAAIVSGCTAQILQRHPFDYRHIPAALAQSTALSGLAPVQNGQPSYRVPQLRCQQALDRVSQKTTISPNRSGLSGTWYDPSTSGQGFVLDIVPQQPAGMTFFGGWYAYAATGGSTAASQRWYIVQSTAGFNPTGSTAPVTIYTTPGGSFMQPSGPPTPVGSGIFKFYNCFDADFTYTLPNEGVSTPRTIKLARLYPIVRCNENDTMHAAADSAPKQGLETVAPIKQWGLSGSWFQQSTSGNGLIIEVNPAGSVKYRHASNVVHAREQGSVFVSWYTYSPAASGGPSSYRWFTLQEAKLPPLAPGAVPPFPIYPNPYVSANRINLEITQSLGGVLGAPGVSQAQVGTGWIEYVNCNTINFHYNFTGTTEFSGMSGTLAFNRVTQWHGSCS